MIELDRKIGHKSVMYIYKFFMDRDELAHLVDQAVHDMEIIGDTSSDGYNGIYQLFVERLSFDGAAALWVSVYMRFLRW